MKIFLCKCKDEYKEEKSAMDLLNIKNLENSIKKKKILLNLKNIILWNKLILLILVILKMNLK